MPHNLLTKKAHHQITNKKPIKPIIIFRLNYFSHVQLATIKNSDALFCFIFFKQLCDIEFSFCWYVGEKIKLIIWKLKAVIFLLGGV